MSISGSNRIVTFTCVVCSVGCNAAEFLVRWDLVEQIWQNGRIPDTAACDLNCSYLLCLFINPNMYLTPQAAFGTAVLAGVPFSLAFSFDARAIYQQVQRSDWAFVWDRDELCGSLGDGVI
jgi:hypothetical protein